MSDTDLSDLSIAELNERREKIADDDVGMSPDHIDAELERRAAERDEASELLDYKLQLARAEEHGLGDDPAAERLRDHVADLEAARHPSPQAELAREAGVEEDLVAHLADDTAERAAELVDAIEMGRNASSKPLRITARENYAELENLLADDDVAVAKLAEAPPDEESVTAADLIDGA